MTQLVLKVSGMSCQHCVKAVQDALMALDGVQNAQVSLDAGEVTVHYDATKTSPPQMQEAIENQGYDVV
ncbi:MAG: copper chaperone CopZ [Clostridiales bacterium]|jgi:copper chaperone|nr:copper chaperone CopZ [Clostridiales bacterium]